MPIDVHQSPLVLYCLYHDITQIGKNSKLGVFNQKFNPKDEEQEKIRQHDSEREFYALSENRIRFSVAIAVLPLWPDL